MTTLVGLSLSYFYFFGFPGLNSSPFESRGLGFKLFFLALRSRPEYTLPPTLVLRYTPMKARTRTAKHGGFFQAMRLGGVRASSVSGLGKFRVLRAQSTHCKLFIFGYITERFEDLRFKVGGNVLSSCPYADDLLFPLYNSP